MKCNPRVVVYRWLQFLISVLTVLSMVAVSPPVKCFADDLDNLARETQKQIKNAENSMFSGKNEEALTLLNEAAANIETIKASSPAHRMLRSLETSYDRTRKALDRKLGPAPSAIQRKTPAPPPTEPTPPPATGSDADSLAKQAGTQLRDAENMMFNGKNEEALAQLDAAAATIGQVKDLDPGHKQLATLENTYARTKKTLEAKLQPKEQPAAAPPAATDSQQTDKLPGGVSKRLKDIEQTLARIEGHLDSGGSASQARYMLDGAAGTFDEIDRQYSGKYSPDHPDYQNTRAKYAEVEEKVKTAEGSESAGKAAAAQAEDVKKALSADWTARFAPYITGPYQEGYNPDKYLLFPGTSKPEEIAKMQKIHEELSTLYAAYEKTDFPNGKTWELEDAADKAKRAMEDFSNSYTSGMQGVAEQAGSNLDQALTHLNREDWKSDKTATPPIIDRNWAERINDMMAKASEVLPANDPQLKVLKEKHQQMVQKDQEHRNIWAERTYMLPEVYKGKDLKDIRKMAESIVEKEIPGAKILRVTVYKDDWQEESVLEHTDTTQTALRYRVTRMIYAQVAAKKDGAVKLHTLYIAKDKQSDGWSSLYGHIMSSDTMLEKNVDKKGP